MLKYIKLNDKKQPMENFNTYYTSYKDIENVGLLLNKNTVVVDFDNDNKEESRIINYLKTKYDTLWVETTRGIHFYFKKPDNLKIKNGADKICVAGWQCDYKTGSKSYAIVKLNGITRKTNKKISFDNLEELPIYLYPLQKAKNISGLKNGDGRNNSLYYHLKLIQEQYTEIELQEISKFINIHVFENPLNEKELNTILDSVINSKSSGFYNGDSKDMISFAEFISKELDIKLYNHQLYFYDGLKYSRDSIKLNRAINKYLKLKKSQYTELTHQLYTYSEYVENSHNIFKVKLLNGVIVENTVVDYNCGFTPFFLNVKYDPNCYDKNVDDFLNFICCNKNDLRLVIEEILGHILLVDRFPHKLFFLIGSGANGKSTFVEMITRWVGELSSHIDISSFDDGTSLSSLVGKLVNVADDVDAVYLEKSKNLKTMASGNTVGTRAIYSQPIEFRNTSSLIFTANEAPVFKDKSDGISRRLVIIPFDNKVKTRIPNLDELLSTDKAKSYLLNLALNGITRIYDNNLELSHSETIETTTNQYYLDNDSILAYLNDYPDIDNNITSSVYEAYEEYCTNSNLKAISLNKFTRRIKSLGYETKSTTVMGKKVRVFKKTTN